MHLRELTIKREYRKSGCNTMPKRLPDRVNNRSIASNKTFVEKHQKTLRFLQTASMDMQNCETVFPMINKDKTFKILPPGYLLFIMR